jgi:excisionase family DNA binding protein
MGVSEVAEALGLHRQTLYGMLKRNAFPVRPLSLPGLRKIRFATSEIESFVKRKEGKRSTK